MCSRAILCACFRAALVGVRVGVAVRGRSFDSGRADCGLLAGHRGSSLRRCGENGLRRSN